MEKQICDCERGYNGLGYAGRACDCQSEYWVNPYSGEKIELRDWMPGDSEYGLMGFNTKEDLDRYQRNEPGPFKRRVRPKEWGPPSLEAQATRAYLDGNIGEFLEAMKADGTKH